MKKFTSIPAALLQGAAFGLCAALLTAPIPALALYKIIGPDGQPIYTDRDPGTGKATQINAGGSSVSSANLPYELRAIVARYPVTIYTSTNCGPCESGRALLKQRGIPFAERTINNADDARALQAAEGSSELPVLHVGAQHLRGFSSGEWSSYLDAAGYPRQSILPASYQYASPQPMVAKTAPAENAPAYAPKNTTPPTNNGEPAGNAPPGFKF